MYTVTCSYICTFYRRIEIGLFKSWARKHKYKQNFEELTRLLFNRYLTKVACCKFGIYTQPVYPKRPTKAWQNELAGLQDQRQNFN